MVRCLLPLRQFCRRQFANDFKTCPSKPLSARTLSGGAKAGVSRRFTAYKIKDLEYIRGGGHHFFTSFLGGLQNRGCNPLQVSNLQG
jgi:hypothetical protein